MQLLSRKQIEEALILFRPKLLIPLDPQYTANPGSQIERLSGGLITIVNDRLQVIHKSVIEFSD